MTETRVETKTQVTIDGWSFRLQPEHDLDDLMSRIEAAATTGPSFVQLQDGESMVKVLVSPQSKVLITVSPRETNGTGDTPAFEPTLTTDMTDWEL
ncbi:MULTISPECIES: hypothetical protein [unclassified Microbacterium]|uniref:hypothetical protein n=1 Tax=unclassified Microbacterium TaxID=2609290 RepID=UPI003465B094